MSRELDATIQHILDNDPRLAEEAKELLSWMMREAKLVMQHGTGQAKAALISRGLSSILSHAATAKQVDELSELRGIVESIRLQVFADVPSVTQPHRVPDSAPTDSSARVVV